MAAAAAGRTCKMEGVRAKRGEWRGARCCCVLLLRGLAVLRRRRLSVRATLLRRRLTVRLHLAAVATLLRHRLTVLLWRRLSRVGLRRVVLLLLRRRRLRRRLAILVHRIANLTLGVRERDDLDEDRDLAVLDEVADELVEPDDRVLADLWREDEREGGKKR